MILINLLPHREEKRRLRKQAFFVGLGLSAVAGAVLVALWYVVLQQMTASQMERNDFLRGAITKLDEEIKDVSSLKGEIEALKARQRAVEDLQTDRNMPVYLLNELVRQTPEGVYLTAIRQDGQSVLVNGQAQTNERVAEFLRNTNANSQWLERADLQEIKAVASNARDNKRLFDFSMRVSLKRPQDVSAAAAAAASAPAAPSAPSAPAPGASAPAAPASAPVVPASAAASS
ncbi:PilN domain-containing protein [uncultured Aquabacterium sp.]|jgi:type IV pilus assembly protein PilN|uniref:PilN domain-containing protein n=1 Tax=uncultured Aquabacterium sp. TaxID=158753 RepID=UPI00261D0B68|nr:PilN domain-containing protein [uncultured Aquabacterium sp.]